MNLHEVAERFEGVRWSGATGFSCRCPAHDDQRASLSVGSGEKGIVMRCHAGCETAVILPAVNLTFPDLLNGGHGNGHRPGGMNIVQTYDYRDADGRVLYQVCRLDPKDFRARRPDGAGGYVWNLRDTARVLYHLPELIAADLATVVHIVEGEKDVDRLRGLGLVATCNPGGAGKWLDAYSSHLKDRHVVILPDKDTPGQEHAIDIAQRLSGIAASVRVVYLPNLPGHGDVSDWLNAGHDVEELVRLEEAAPAWAPASIPRNAQAAIIASPILAELDLLTLISKGVPAVIMDIEDYLPRRTLCYMTGAPKGWKTWTSLDAAVCLGTGQSFAGLRVPEPRRVLFLEAESWLQIPERFERLCRGHQVTPADVLQNVRFMIPNTPLRLESPAHAEALLQAARDWRADWIILDSFVRLHGLDENSSHDMALLANGALLPLRDQGGCGVLVLDHPPKPFPGGQRGRKEQIRGSWEKLAAADVQLHVDAIDSDEGKLAALSVAASRVAPERDEPVYLKLRDTQNGGIRFEQTIAPDITVKGRKPTQYEQAVNIITAERGRTPTLTYADAIRAVEREGISNATGKRAWNSLKGQGSEGSESILTLDPGKRESRGQKGHTPIGGDP